MSLFVEIMGWAGAVLVLSAYALLSMKKLVSDSYRYHGMNIIGSLMLGFYAIYKNASASFLVNAVWFCIGIVAIYNLKRAK